MGMRSGIQDECEGFGELERWPPTGAGPPTVAFGDGLPRVR